VTARRPRALDVSCGVGAAYAAKLLAELDWDVVKYERPGGDPLRNRVSRWGGGAGGAFAFVNQGKRGISGPAAELLPGLAAAADVVIGDFSPPGLTQAGLDPETADTLAPAQAVVSVSPFGLTPPRASWAASDLVVQAAGGLLYMTGEWDQPPQQMAPDQAALLGGVAGASAAVLAAGLGRRTGTVQYADIAMAETVASFAYGAVSQYVHRGEVTAREQRIKAGLRMVPAQDRFVYCAPGAVNLMRMDGIAELLDEPRLAAERFQTAEGRMRNWDEFLALFTPPFRTRSAQEWFERAEALHMTFALVQTADDLFGCPQLSARGLLRSGSGPGGAELRLPGRPFRIDGTPSLDLRPAPAGPGCDTVEVLADWAQAERDLAASPVGPVGGDPGAARAGGVAEPPGRAGPGPQQHVGAAAGRAAAEHPGAVLGDEQRQAQGAGGGQPAPPG
jgi:crotonobetainyl-CoA:carnitine CoA-transferase CaiB-like acyl-CoA transferase